MTDKLMKSSIQIPIPQWDTKHDSAATEIWQSDHILAHGLKVTGTDRATGEVNTQAEVGRDVRTAERCQKHLSYSESYAVNSERRSVNNPGPEPQLTIMSTIFRALS